MITVLIVEGDMRQEFFLQEFERLQVEAIALQIEKAKLTVQKASVFDSLLEEASKTAGELGEMIIRAYKDDVEVYAWAFLLQQEFILALPQEVAEGFKWPVMQLCRESMHPT